MELGAFKEALMGLAYKLFDTHKERTDWLGRNLKNMNHKSASAVPDAERAEAVTKFSILAKEIADSRKA